MEAIGAVRPGVKRAKFNRFNQPSIICHCCGKRTTEMTGEGTDLCGVCYQSAGIENEHSDTNGEHYGQKPTNCATCLGLSCMHEAKATKKGKAIIAAISEPENAAKLNQAIKEVVAEATTKLALDASGRRHG